MAVSTEEDLPEKKRAVVLLNFGGPRNLEEVSDFLYEILKDPNTLQLPVPQPLQNLLARRIARGRSAEMRRQYSQIGGRSPIVAATEAIRDDLRSALAEAGAAMPVFVAHRYLPGWCEDTAREIVAGGVDELLAVPLYPHFSYATTGSALEQLRAALLGAGYRGRLRAVRSYPDEEPYLEALAERLRDCLEREPPPPEDTVVLCSAHGLPEAYVKAGDPYRDELHRTLEALQRRFSGWRFVLSFQSRVGPAQWLKPYTDRIVPELAAQGVKHLAFFPISFVNDHIETLYEIGHTYFTLARQGGMTPRLVPAVENHPEFIRMIAGQVLRWRDGQGGVPAEALLPPPQHFARLGRWAWGLWLAALASALLYALS